MAKNNDILYTVSENVKQKTEDIFFTEKSVTDQRSVINGVKYFYLDLSSNKFCMAREVNTGMGNRVAYELEVPEGWLWHGPPTKSTGRVGNMKPMVFGNH
jgi:hypothetical protein